MLFENVIANIKDCYDFRSAAFSCLQALGVPLVLNLAGSATATRSRAGVALSTTLAVWRLGSAVGSSGRGGLDGRGCGGLHAASRLGAARSDYHGADGRSGR